MNPDLELHCHARLRTPVPKNRKKKTIFYLNLLCVKLRNSTPRHTSPERQNENIKYFIPQIQFEPALALY